MGPVVRVETCIEHDQEASVEHGPEAGVECDLEVDTGCQTRSPHWECAQGLSEGPDRSPNSKSLSS